MERPTALPAKPSLAALQSWLRWIITEPRGVSAALESSAMDRREPLPRRLNAIVEAPPINRRERLDVYAEAYFARLAESLSKDFCAVAATLGEAAFHRLCARYLKAHPSTSPGINDVGQHLAAFLDAGDAETDHLPYLADLARLEWTVLESFFADQLPTLDPARLAAVPPESWTDVRLSFDPTFRMIEAAWAVDETWRTGADPVEHTISLAVHRSHGCVAVERLDPAAAQLLRLLVKGHALGDALETVSEIEDVSDLFQSWVASGMIRGIDWNC